MNEEASINRCSVPVSSSPSLAPESLKPLESVAELTFLDRPLPPSELYPLIRDADALITRSGHPGRP